MVWPYGDALRQAKHTHTHTHTHAHTLYIYIHIYKGADKSLARIDNSYVKIKHISCLSAL